MRPGPSKRGPEQESSDDEPLAARTTRKRVKSSSHVSGKRMVLGTPRTCTARFVNVTEPDGLDWLAQRRGAPANQRKRNNSTGVSVVDLWDGTVRPADRSDEV